MAISVLGIDYKTAGVDVREQVALTREQAAHLLQAVADEKIFAEAVIVSTCNRTEFYVVSEEGQEGDFAHLLVHHAEAKGLPAPLDQAIFWRLDGAEAVQHLFRVASSLESQIVGEREIQGQVKEAYRVACDQRTAKFFCHKLMHWSFLAAKRVMTETALGQGTASVSQAAVDLARQVFTSMAGKTVLLMGAGQTAELACQALVRAGASSVVVANRTLANAQQLTDSFLQWQQAEASWRTLGLDEEHEAIRCPALANLLAMCPMRPSETAASAPKLAARAITLEEIPSVIANVDLVICSTGATEPVLRAAAMRTALHGVRHSLLMIDISMPRNIEPAVGELPNVFLYNMDALEGLVERNLRQRRSEIPRAEAIIDSEVDRFGQWVASLGVVPTIKLLTQRVAELQQAELARYQKKFSAGERDQLGEFARSLCNKILHDPIAFLRQLDEAGEDRSLSSVSVLREIFNLDGAEKEKAPRR